MTEGPGDLDRLVDALDTILSGDARRRIVDGVTERGHALDWITRLKSQMERHRLRAGDETFDLGRDVTRLEARTWEDGF